MLQWPHLHCCCLQYCSSLLRALTCSFLCLAAALRVLTLAPCLFYLFCMPACLFCLFCLPVCWSTTATLSSCRTLLLQCGMCRAFKGCAAAELMGAGHVNPPFPTSPCKLYGKKGREKHFACDWPCGRMAIVPT